VVLALIEMNGAGDLLGVWVARTDSYANERVFFTDEARLAADHLVARARPVVIYSDRTWRDFLVHLHARQNLITVQRIRTETGLGAAELLHQVDYLWHLWNE